MRYRNLEDLSHSVDLPAFMKNLGMIAAELDFGLINASPRSAPDVILRAVAGPARRDALLLG